MIELDGKRWTPVPGTTATAEEFIAGRSLLHEIHQQCLWSPWVMQDRAREYDAALKTCEQWTSTDPASPCKTLEEYEAGLEQARLAMLEEQGILADKIRQRDEILSSDLFRLADEEDRRKLLAGLEHDIATKTQEVWTTSLRSWVTRGRWLMPRGWLPAERRTMALTLFKAERGREVRDLRTRIADGQATLKSLKGMPERAEFREALRKDKARLAYLEQMPPLGAAGMCSECVSPAWHTPGVTYSLDGAWDTGGPCPAWPQWAKGVNAAREARGARPPRAC